jgi:hypothetical protein
MSEVVLDRTRTRRRRRRRPPWFRRAVFLLIFAFAVTVWSLYYVVNGVLLLIPTAVFYSAQTALITRMLIRVWNDDDASPLSPDDRQLEQIAQLVQLGMLAAGVSILILAFSGHLPG